jgi:hypothetical protein
MKISTVFTTRRSTIDDAPLFYAVINKTMRNFMMATWGRWNEDRVRQESLEDSVSPNPQVIQVGDVDVGESIAPNPILVANLIANLDRSSNPLLYCRSSHNDLRTSTGIGESLMVIEGDVQIVADIG